MCGITGWLGPAFDPQTLSKMTDTITHRGPDGEGQLVLPLKNGSVAALGHRRLSIIDLAGGVQPMQSHDRRYTVVYNGEIYNFIELRDELRAEGAKFVTNSDTEVILEAWRAWGIAAFTRFRGMFALALHDAETRSVILARDPFGKKPLFINETKTAEGPLLVFGSEIRSVLAHPAMTPKLDVASLYDYLSWRYVPGPATFFEGIRKLLPGSCLYWNDGKITEERYWIPPEELRRDQKKTQDAIEEFLDVFDQSVKIRLRADVPLGAFLSSGLDSASIVATLAHLGAPEIRTFSVGFKGDPFSELPAAAETAAMIGTIHTPLELETDDLTQLLPMLSQHRGAPVAETADLPIYLMSIEAAKHVKVILSGEGADEMFAGYPKHLVEAYLGRFAPSGLLSLAGHALSAATAVAPVKARRLRIAARAMKARGFEDRMIGWFGALSRPERAALWRGPEIVRETSQIPFNAAPGSSPLRKVLHFDQTSWLPDNLLERMDMMTMAASIEGRTPFMDVRLAEWASSLPQNWRIQGRTTKRIVREALNPRLPDAVIKRPKNGFKLPVTQWFRGPLREPFRDMLLGHDAITSDYLDQAAISKLADDHAEGRADHDKTLWALYALETFLKEFF